jgi:hypothetical protein
MSESDEQPVKPHRTWWLMGLCTAGTLVVLTTLSSFVGLYEHREHGTWYLFLKHRPTLKMHFFAPLGESDKTLSDLPENLQTEETWFVTYVERGRGESRSIRLPFQ